MQAWRTFLDGVSGLSAEYQLEDLVLTGRILFAEKAHGRSDLISEHAGISPKWATHYSSHTRPTSNIRDVMSELNQQHKRKG